MAATEVKRAGRLAYREAVPESESGTPVLLVHGFPESSYMWHELLPDGRRHVDPVSAPGFIVHRYRPRIEGLFARPRTTRVDVAHSLAEERLRVIGKTDTGRYVFLVFTTRERNGERFIRPISARYMHGKEVEHYEKENPDLRE